MSVKRIRQIQKDIQNSTKHGKISKISGASKNIWVEYFNCNEFISLVLRYHII